MGSGQWAGWLINPRHTRDGDRGFSMKHLIPQCDLFGPGWVGNGLLMDRDLELGLLLTSLTFNWTFNLCQGARLKAQGSREGLGDWMTLCLVVYRPFMIQGVGKACIRTTTGVGIRGPFG